jgi:hypothetical protein
MRFPIALCLLVISGLPAGAAGEQFGRWTATCRDDGYCQATSLHEPAAGRAPAEYELRVGRWADQTYWELSLDAKTALPPATEPATIEVDGAPTIFEGTAEIARFGSERSYFFMGRPVQEVMDRLMQARTVTVGFTGPDGAPQQVGFSLDGLTEALIQIDSWQGRLGSERVAEAAPAHLVPLDGPAVAAVPGALAALRDADSQCGPLEDLQRGDDIVIDTALDGVGPLYLLPCWDAAYNFGWRGYLQIIEGHYELLALPEVSAGGAWTATSHIVNYVYDPAANELSTFYRGSGTRVCGTAGLYRWRNHVFELVEFRARECSEPPTDTELPLVYPAN